jgi:hypothetical protein
MTRRFTEHTQSSTQSLAAKIVDLVFRVSLFVLLVRSVILATYPWLGDNPLRYDFLADRFHHYQAGLAFILVGLVLYWKRRVDWATFFALPMALILEEYPIIVGDLGLPTPYPYLSTRDNAIIYSLAIGGVLAAYRAKKSLRAGAQPRAD